MKTRPSLEHLLAHTPGLVGVASTDGRFVRLSAAWEKLLGAPLSELEGAEFIQFVHADDVAPTLKALARLNRNLPVISFENRYLCATGKHRRLVWRSNRGEDGFIYFIVEDVTEARTLHETLEASSERLRQVAEIAGIGSWEVDLINQTVFWDETTRRIHDVPDEYVPTLEAGVNFYDGDAAETIGRAVQNAIDTGVAWDLVLPLITFTGNQIFVRASGRPLLVEGVATRLTGTFQDITEQQEYAEHLELRRVAAETANEAKSRFLANMSHEIRTPLNGVLGMAQLLQRTPVNERQSFYLETLRESGNALASLVDDVLDLARIEAGEVRLAEERFNLHEVIGSARSAIAAQAAQKELMVTVSIDRLLPKDVLGDSVRLKQVLINLLGNAVKFSDRGAIKLLAEPLGDACVHVSVIDTGPGVPDAMKGLIFERFTQVDSSDTRRNSGTGLGLAICRDLVKLAGGRIGVKDTPGGGATFWVEWPITQTSVSSTKNPLPHKREPEKTVLVAEDNMTNAVMLQEALGGAGYKVLHAHNGRDAVKLARTARPDLILMDIHMPELSGIEAIMQIRREINMPAPCIVLTADVTAEMRQKIEDLAPLETFSKPFDLNILLQTVDRTLSVNPLKSIA
ncbi:ATP-binding protein [Maricaulaceae bacterium MS644]